MAPSLISSSHFPIWNNGKTEIMSFTDIDASASFGGVLKGNSWGRPGDSIGLAGAINALSADHRAFIARAVWEFSSATVRSTIKRKEFRSPIIRSRS
jgi:hypothetical protein